MIPVVPWILLFMKIHADSTLFQYPTGQFFGTGTNSTWSRQSPGFCHLSVFTRILHFVDTWPISFLVLAQIFRYWHEFYLIGLHVDSTLFWYLTDQFFGTRTDSTWSRQSPGFCHLSVFTRILHFFDTWSINFLVLAQILLDPGGASDSTVYWYSFGFYAVPIPDRSIFWYWQGFYLIPVVLPILPFIGLHADSTFFQYLTDQFF